MIYDGRVKSRLNTPASWRSLHLRFASEKRVDFYGDFSLAAECGAVIAVLAPFDGQFISARWQGAQFLSLERGAPPESVSPKRCEKYSRSANLEYFSFCSGNASWTLLQRGYALVNPPLRQRNQSHAGSGFRNRNLTIGRFGATGALWATFDRLTPFDFPGTMGGKR